VIEVELLASPRELPMGGRDAFEVGVAATNRGTATVDPGLAGARLLVDGQDFLPFGDAVGNGFREADWFALPPEQSVSMTWKEMGELLFPSPGEYTLQIRLDDAESAPVVVRIDP
jgi:hypothetical protein